MASWSRRVVGVVGLLLTFLLCTSYEYILNFTIATSHFSTYVGFDMVAKVRQVEKALVDPEANGFHSLNINLKKTSSAKTTENNLAKTRQETIVEATRTPKRPKAPPETHSPGTASTPPPAPSHASTPPPAPSPASTPPPTPSSSTSTANRSEQAALAEAPVCPAVPPGLQGRVAVVREAAEWATILGENPGVARGGEHRPAGCRARHMVALVIPYRRRLPHLAALLRHLHPILQRQQLHYRVYVVNQADTNTFNRAMLLNVGFVEAMRDGDWTCAVFHDVDLLPEDDRNLYTCPAQPRHLSVAVDKFKYRLPYKMLFGGASAIRSDQFRDLNGYSNMFWGWGAEDDDMSKRIRYHKLKIVRYPATIGRYTMLRHEQEAANKLRQHVLRSSHRRYATDGLNSLRYSLVSKEERPLYTLLSVALFKEARSRGVLGRARANRRG